MEQKATLSPQRIARTGGWLYVLILAGAVFANFYIRDALIVGGDALATAQNIAEHETRFRLAIVIELFTFTGILALAWAFYLLFRPVRHDLALLAMLWWVGEGILLAVALVFNFGTLYMIRDAAYLSGLEAAQQDALGYLFHLFYFKQYEIGLFVFSPGSFLFSYLFFISRYLPRWLAVLGMVGSALIFLRVVVITLYPEASRILGLPTLPPIFLYELLAGLWLIVRGVNESDAKKPA